MSESGSASLRLGQICLVSARLAQETENIKAILGLEECYRDPKVARYALENVLFPIGTDFIEIVAPTREDTAAGRFLERHGACHGYMIIMECDDPARRQAHCAGMGVRTAHVIQHEDYLGVQLHPKDTGGAMLEFNRTVGGGDSLGPYAPAGANWQQAIRCDVTNRLVAAQIECPDPGGLASRWSQILQKPAQALMDGRWQIALDSGAIHFLPSERADAVLAGIELQVVDRERIVQAARARGCLDTAAMVDICGVRFQLS